MIFTATEDYEKKCTKKESQEYECLQDWVQHVKQMVRSKVNSPRKKTVESKRHGNLELNSVKECLKELQEKYVFVPADKAANRDLKQTDAAAAERRWSTNKFLFRRTQG